MNDTIGEKCRKKWRCHPDLKLWRKHGRSVKWSCGLTYLSGMRQILGGTLRTLSQRGDLWPDGHSRSKQNTVHLKPQCVRFMNIHWFRAQTHSHCGLLTTETALGANLIACLLANKSAEIIIFLFQ